MEHEEKMYAECRLALLFSSRGYYYCEVANNQNDVETISRNLDFVQWVDKEWRKVYVV